MRLPETAAGRPAGRPTEFRSADTATAKQGTDDVESNATCSRCGRPLTALASVLLGVGPVCLTAVLDERGGALEAVVA